MKIAVCMKQVPADNNEVRVDPKTNTLIRQGVPGVINPDDLAGIETALQLKEAAGGQVTAVCMGLPQAEEALREALAMGCDKALLLTDRGFAGSDTYATSAILAAGLKKIGFDLVIAGRQAADSDTAQVGPELAERLGVPQMTGVTEVKAEGEWIFARRQAEDRYYMLRVKTPCLITTVAEGNPPRYMTVKGVVDAYAAPVERLGYEELKDHLAREDMGAAGSPTSVVSCFEKQAKGRGAVVKASPDEAVKAIMEALKAKHII